MTIIYVAREQCWNRYFGKYTGGQVCVLYCVLWWVYSTIDKVDKVDFCGYIGEQICVFGSWVDIYGVATVSRIDKIIGLFCKRDL